MIVDFALDFYQVIEIVGLIIAPSVIAVVLYFRKMEKKIDGFEDELAKNKECFIQTKEQLEKHEVNVNNMFQEHKLEAKDDESTLKVLSASVNTLTEKVSESEKIHIELKNAIRDLAIELKNLVVDQRNFMTNWNQRIEDRIEGLREEFKQRG